MKLVVGLGNPGMEYVNTRHNVGFMFLDSFFSDFKLNKKFNAMEKIVNINNCKVIVIKPLSFMNLSGGVVKKYVNYYNISPSDIYVIQDDLDMSVGHFKVCFNHNAGGHNGISNIISEIGSKEFVRIKFGIGKDSSVDIVNYVLGTFKSEELGVINSLFCKFSDIFNDITLLSIDGVMNKYNSIR